MKRQTKQAGKQTPIGGIQEAETTVHCNLTKTYIEKLSDIEEDERKTLYNDLMIYTDQEL